MPCRWLISAIIALCITNAFATSAQDISEEPLPLELPDVDEVVEPITTFPASSASSITQRQPITKAELEEAYTAEAVAIANEQLRREIELLAREYREAEGRNEIRLFGLGAFVALIFLGIGVLIGKRFGGRRLL